MQNVPGGVGRGVAGSPRGRGVPRPDICGHVTSSLGPAARSALTVFFKPSVGGREVEMGEGERWGEARGGTRREAPLEVGVGGSDVGL